MIECSNISNPMLSGYFCTALDSRGKDSLVQCLMRYLLKAGIDSGYQTLDIAFTPDKSSKGTYPLSLTTV